jgi:hypothetical protein
VIDSATNDGRKREIPGAAEQPSLLPGINSLLVLPSLSLFWKLDYSV